MRDAVAGGRIGADAGEPALGAQGQSGGGDAAVADPTPVHPRGRALSARHDARAERRAAVRPVSGADNLFRERTIEAEERAEEAVVSKEARVTEELVVKKDVGQRTETVSDKVRRTEVEVDDERGNALRSGERKTR